MTQSSFNAKAGKSAAKKPFDQWEKTDPERALVRYAELGDIAGVRRMLAAKADVNTVVHFNNGIETVEDTPLHAAAGAGHQVIIDVLIAAGAQVNVAINDNETPLIHAAMNGWSKTAQALIDAGAHVDHAESYEGYTALHYAARLGREGTARVLLAANADMTIKSKNGETAEDMICAQIGMGHQEYQELYDKIQGAFMLSRARRRSDAEKALREKGKLAAALENAPVLQRDMPVGKPLRLKPRHP